MTDVKKVNISLIICTRNRAEQLRKCLEALNTDEILKVSGELIIVNNNSTDHTAEVLNEYQKNCRCPLKIVNGSKTGLSNARNAGILESEGDIIAFTDDDCYLASGYFEELLKHFKKEEFSYGGGLIELYDSSDVPYSISWLKEKRIIPPNSFIPAGLIQGANMFFRREVFDKIGLFDPELGAGTPFRCEDIDYLARASFSGFKGTFIPEPMVYHHHGRKPGPDFERFKRSNDYARGSYYAKFILMRRYIFLKTWIKITRHRLKQNRKDEIGRFLREVIGAIHYTGVRFRNLIIGIKMIF